MAIFAVVVVILLLCARLLILNLPPDRTALLPTARILAAAVLTIGGPIIGLFLAITNYRRITGDPTKPPPLSASFAGRARMRRRRVTLFVAVGIPVGLGLMLFGGAMIIPAAWGASGDMPPGPGNPSDMQFSRTLLYIVTGIAAAGAALLVTSLVTGIIVLLTHEKDGE